MKKGMASRSGTLVMQTSLSVFRYVLSNLYGNAYLSHSVVFVHGLTGHRDETWTADSRDRPWPVELLPEFFPNARLMTFGYNADVVKFGRNASLDRLPGHANVLLQHLVGERDGLVSILATIFASGR